MFPRFFRSPSGFRVSPQVLFHWFDVVEFSEFSVAFPTRQFLPTSRVLKRVDLTLCDSLVPMNGSESDECHQLILSDGWYIDEKHPRGIPREGGGRRRAGCVLCASLRDWCVAMLLVRPLSTCRGLFSRRILPLSSILTTSSSYRGILFEFFGWRFGSNPLLPVVQAAVATRRSSASKAGRNAGNWRL